MSTATAQSLRLYRPRPATVRTAANGDPISVGNTKVESVREHWVVEDRWWTKRALRRNYFELAMQDGSVLVVFRELQSGRWYSQRGA